MTRRLVRLPLVAAALGLLPATEARAADWNVPADAPTIQAGIDSAQAGDQVVVACGTYFESEIVVKSGITLRSDSGAADCVTIDAQQDGRVLVCRDLDPTTTIVGFTLTGGLGTGGDPASLGGAVYCSNASPWIENCLIRGNAGDYGGGIHCRDQSSPTIVGCIFRDNISETMGGGLFCFEDSSPTVEFCTFSGNQAAGFGGAVYLSSSCSPRLESCTLYGNTDGIGCVDQSEPTLEMCIVAWSTVGPAFTLSKSPGPALSCCDLFQNAGGDWVGAIAPQLGVDGNLAAAPLFCAERPDQEGDWTIAANSPCAAAQSACGEMGAWTVGCEAMAGQPHSWGSVKTLYR